MLSAPGFVGTNWIICIPVWDKTWLENLTGGYWREYGRGNSWIPILEVAINFLLELNGSGTMVLQGDWVQLEQSDMRLFLNTDKIPREEFWCATIDEMRYVIKKPHAAVLAEKKWGVGFPRNGHVKAVKVGCLAMVHEKWMDSSLPCQKGTTENMQTHWRCKCTGALLPDWCRHPTPEPATPTPRMPPVPPCYHEGAHSSQIQGVPCRYVYIYSALPNAQSFNLDPYVKDIM